MIPWAPAPPFPIPLQTTRNGVTMSHTFVSPRATTDIRTYGNPRIQHRNGIEFPGRGEWVLDTTSSISISARRHTVQTRATGGSLSVADPPSRTELEVTFGDAERGQTVITARTVAIEENDDGFARFHMSGHVVTDGLERPIDVTVDHHGVYRRGERTWAWLTAHAQLQTRRRRHFWTIDLDLLARPPDTSQPNDGGWTSAYVAPEVQTAASRESNSVGGFTTHVSGVPPSEEITAVSTSTSRIASTCAAFPNRLTPVARSSAPARENGCDGKC